MFKFISNIINAQRNTKLLAEAETELFLLEEKTKSIISHATGGVGADIDDALNDICVEISALRNHIYHEGRKMERELLSGDLLHSMHEAERKVLVTLHSELGRPLALVAEETGLALNDVRTLAKGLVIKGLAYFGPLFDTDGGYPKGSGYVLTDDGAELKTRALAADVAASAAKAVAA
jgi:hypothetical protein